MRGERNSAGRPEASGEFSSRAKAVAQRLGVHRDLERPPVEPTSALPPPIAGGGSPLVLRATGSGAGWFGSTVLCVDPEPATAPQKRPPSGPSTCGAAGQPSP